MSAVDWVMISKAARAAAAESIAACRRSHPGGHFIQRHVEVLAIDHDDERIGDPLEYLELRELSGKRLAQVVRDHAPAQYAYITVQGGIDGYSSFSEAMAYPDDYDPGCDWWEVNTRDLQMQREDRIDPEAAERPAPGQGVAARIDRHTIVAQHREAAAQLDECAGIVMQRLYSREA